MSLSEAEWGSVVELFVSVFGSLFDMLQGCILFGTVSLFDVLVGFLVLRVLVDILNSWRDVGD